MLFFFVFELNGFGHMLSWLVLGLDRLTCFGFGCFECDNRQVIGVETGL